MLVSRPLQAAFVRACTLAAQQLLCHSRAQSGGCLHLHPTVHAWLSCSPKDHLRYFEELYYDDPYRLLLVACHEENAERPQAALASAYQHAVALAASTLPAQTMSSPFSFSMPTGLVCLASKVYVWVSHIAQQRHQRHDQSHLAMADALLDPGEYERQGFRISLDARAEAVSLVRKLDGVEQDLRRAGMQHWTQVLSSFLSSLSPQHLSLLLGFRRTPGSSDTPLPFSLSSCLFAAAQLPQYDADAFAAYSTYVHREPHLQRTTYPKPKPPSLLTAAGKAFSKHAHRDTSTSFWGTASGSQLTINNKAIEALVRILQDAVWINQHALPHGLQALEVRCGQGYGARWLLAPAPGVGLPMFRGFLEPHDEDGHERGWRH